MYFKRPCVSYSEFVQQVAYPGLGKIAGLTLKLWVWLSLCMIMESNTVRPLRCLAQSVAKLADSISGSIPSYVLCKARTA